MTDLPRRFRAQAEQCALHGSPLTAALLVGAADDFEAGGPVHDLLLPLANDPSGTVPSLRFAGALHRMVLEGRAPALAAHYPSVGGTASPDGAWKVARGVIGDHRLASDIRRPVQTNEVGRIARSLQVFKDHLVETTRLRTEQEAMKTRSAEERRADLARIADDFERSIGGVIRGGESVPVSVVSQRSTASARTPS